jgi:nucleoside-diphosphate-sugar epimerase
MTPQHRVAVTGASGFIGRHLTAHLAARGFEVRAILRPKLRGRHSGQHGVDQAGRALHPDVIVVPASLDEPTALAEAFRGANTVIHLAGVVSTVRDADYTAVNVAGTRAVALAACAARARLIHISSLAAAGPATLSLPRFEDHLTAPITPYGRSKLESEWAVAAVAGLRWIVLRPGAVYGPGDRALLPLFHFAARRVLPLIGRPDAAYTFVHVADVVRAITAAVDTDLDRETMFVGHPAPVTARDLLEGVRAAVDGRAVIVPVPRPLARLAACVGDLAGVLRGRPLPLNRWRYRELYAEGFACSVDRLRDQLGIVAEIGLHEGLAQTAAWYREQRWL